MNIKITDVRHQKGDAAFLIDDGKTSILYDTGFGFTGYAVADNVKTCLGERRLDYIFLTHSHYDHALGSAYILRRYPDAKVVAGSYAADVFKRDGAKRVMKELDAKFAGQCGVTDYEFLGDELKVDVTVNDGDIIHAGDMDFTAITLPGHTRCCVGFYCEKEGLLLSNETLGVYDGDKTILPAFLVSFADTIHSIEKVEKLDIKRIFTEAEGISVADFSSLCKNVSCEFKAEKTDELLTSLRRRKSEEEKQKIIAKKLSFEEYEKAIKNLRKKLKV